MQETPPVNSIYVGDAVAFKEVIVNLKNKGAKFMTKDEGRNKYIYINNRELRFLGTAAKTPEDRIIVDVCRAVKADIKKWIEDREGLMPQRMDNIFFSNTIINKSEINNRLGEDLYSIDCNQCYWDIAHFQLGYIYTNTWMKYGGYKMARNIALGNLEKNTTQKWYEGPKQIDSIIHKSPYGDFNYNIRRAAYGLYEAIRDITEDTILLYKVDEVIIPLKYLKKVNDFLRERNMTTSLNICKMYKSLDSSIKIEYLTKQDKSKKVKSLALLRQQC